MIQMVGDNGFVCGYWFEPKDTRLTGREQIMSDGTKLIEVEELKGIVRKEWVSRWIPSDRIRHTVNES